MSPFKSLREVARDRVGHLLSFLLAERFSNIELIEKVRCPVLIIHGPKDRVIGIEHSIALKIRCGSSYCQLFTPDSMDHNTFHVQNDIIAPIKAFFRQVNIKTHRTSDASAAFHLDSILYQIPVSIYGRD